MRFLFLKKKSITEIGNNCRIISPKVAGTSLKKKLWTDNSLGGSDQVEEF